MIKKSSIFLLVIFFFVSCKKENEFDCFKSTGTEITETRDASAFTVIKLFDKIDLNINKGPDFKVEVIAGKHVIDNVKTTLANGILSINNTNKCNFVRGYKRKVTVNITLPYIVRVENRGVGTIRFNENFAQDTIQLIAENSGDIYLNGTYNQIKTGSHGDGDIYLNGTCNRLYGYLYGTNLIDATKLTVNTYIFIETISIADCHINAPEGGTLEYNIWRKGNIYYKGNPSVINSFSNGYGQGKLIKEN